MELTGANDRWSSRSWPAKPDRSRRRPGGRFEVGQCRVRKKLADGGLGAIEASDDPMIKLALLVDPPSATSARFMTKRSKSRMRQAYAKIAQARFAIEGQNTYPDATFTLAAGLWPGQGLRRPGPEVPPWTTIGGAFKHAAHMPTRPFELPAELARTQEQSSICRPRSTSSARPTSSAATRAARSSIAQAEVVGLIFDGNLESLVLDFAYSDEKARAISVDSRAILEAYNRSITPIG